MYVPNASPSVVRPSASNPIAAGEIEMRASRLVLSASVPDS